MTAAQLHWFVLHVLAYLGMELDAAYRAQDRERICSLCCARRLIFRAQDANPGMCSWHLGDCPFLNPAWEGAMSRCLALDSISG